MKSIDAGMGVLKKTINACADALEELSKPAKKGLEDTFKKILKNMEEWNKSQE